MTLGTSTADESRDVLPVAPLDSPDESGDAATGGGGLSRLLTRLVVGIALLTVFGGGAAAVLAWFGLWMPAIAFPVIAVLGALAWRLTRHVPSGSMPRWVVAALVGTALGTTLWAGGTSAEEVVVIRDPASYLQAATQLAEHHTTPFAVDVRRLGGPDMLRIPNVILTSAAFFQDGTVENPSIQPQFLIGATGWYSVGYWLGHEQGAWWTSAVFGGLSVLAIGLITSRLVGARWGPLAAVAAAGCFPLLHVARTTFSEQIALFVLAAGLLLLAEATRAGERGESQATRLGALTGILIAGGCLVRLDALRETMLLVPIAGLLLIRRNPAGRATLRGAGFALLFSLIVWIVESPDYVGINHASVLPLSILLGITCAVVAVFVRAGLRGGHMPAAVRRHGKWALPAGVIVVGLVLASRPWWLVSRSAAESGAVRLAQMSEGLPIDPTRHYDELSLVWTSWWVGPAALAVSFVTVAGLARVGWRAWTSGGTLPAWVGPLGIAFLSAVLTWIRPGITPDHPWADRRLFIALPMVIVTFTAGLAWLVGSARRRSTAMARLVAPVGALVLLVPLGSATAPLAINHLLAGELDAVDGVCPHLHPNDIVVSVDAGAVTNWTQLIRGNCGVPALGIDPDELTKPEAVKGTLAMVRSVATRSHRNVVLVATSKPSAITRVAPTSAPVKPQQVVDLTTQDNAMLVTRRPVSTVTATTTLWLARLP